MRGTACVCDKHVWRIMFVERENGCERTYAQISHTYAHIFSQFCKVGREREARQTDLAIIRCCDVVANEPCDDRPERR